MSYMEAARSALHEEMQRDERVFIMGTDIVGSVYGATGGLSEKFGIERVRNTPISEECIVGAAAGAAMVGMRPIGDLSIASFAYPAMDQICSIIAKSRYLYGGQASLPLVLRLIMFYGGSNAAQHSDRPYPMFMGMPGLKIIIPSNAYDMKGLLKSAVRDDDPVMCFEDVNLWSRKMEVPSDPEFLVPIGVADIKREGKDVTVIAIAATVNMALAAAEELAKENISVEVVDPRTLVPMDRDTILRSVRKTGRAVVVDPAHLTCSAASEIAATIAERAFSALKAPVARVTSPDVHMPFSPVMEKALLPNKDRVVSAVKAVVDFKAQ
jgi:pyruvate dehydrogenase E1 component beta subunit